MGLLDNYRDDYIYLCEAGFIAVNQMDEDSATKLFRASELLNPDITLPKIGFGYLHLCKLELKEAAKVFEEVLIKEPDNEMAKAFLGFCVSLSPEEGVKGEKILEETATKATDPQIKNLASSALAFIERFIKKAPSPAQVQRPKK